jgi:superfamily II DNA or RNA helicase
VKKTKDTIQSEARLALKENNGSGILLIGTGVGKTFLGIQEVIDELQKSDFEGYEPPLIVVPTVRLRDNSWSDEFKKWGYEEEYKSVERSCYVSINKIVGKKYRLIILDECHRITPENYKFFENNQVDRIVMLTATKPKDKQKLDLLLSLTKIVYTYTLDEAVRDGLVSPFVIHIIKVPLDKFTKNVKCGGKKKSWYSTEQLQYDYLCSVIGKSRESLNEWKNENEQLYQICSEYHKVKKEDKGNFLRSFNESKVVEIEKGYKKFVSLSDYTMMKVLERVRFLGSLLSTEKVIDDLINRLLKEQRRFLVFLGSIEQSKKLCGNYVFNSKSNSDAFNSFCEGGIDYCAVVNAVNEGLNIPDCQDSIVGKLDSNDTNFIQRTGRIIRYKDGHRARVFVPVPEGTVYEDWVKSSLKTFNPENIFYHTLLNYHQIFAND